jgi:hypothetical protein
MAMEGHCWPLVAFSGGLEGKGYEVDRAFVWRSYEVVGQYMFRDPEKAHKTERFHTNKVRNLCGFRAKSA